MGAKTHLRSQSLHLPLRGSEKNCLSTWTGGRMVLFFLGSNIWRTQTGRFLRNLRIRNGKRLFGITKLIGKLCWNPVLNYESGNLGLFGFRVSSCLILFLVGNNHWVPYHAIPKHKRQRQNAGLIYAWLVLKPQEIRFACPFDAAISAKKTVFFFRSFTTYDLAAICLTNIANNQIFVQKK